MSTLLLTNTRTSQPTYAVPINKNNTIARDLTFLWSAPFPDWDMQNAAPYSLISSGDLLFEYGTFGRKAAGGNNRGRRFTPKSTGANFTAFAVVVDKVQGVTRNPFDCDDGGSTGRVFQLRFESSNVANFIPFDTGGTPYFSSTTNTASTTGLSLIAGVMNNGVATCYLNSVAATPQSVGTPRFVDGTKTVCVGNFNDPGAAGVQPYGGDIYLCGLIKRALSPAEIKSLTDNPWQLFSPTSRRIVGETAGGANSYSYTATGGLTLGGVAALIKGVSPAGTGGIVFSGAATVVPGAGTQSQTVVASGGYTLGGTAAQARGKVYTTSGGVALAGSATIVLTPDPTPQTIRAFKRGRRPRTRKF